MDPSEFFRDFGDMGMGDFGPSDMGFGGLDRRGMPLTRPSSLGFGPTPIGAAGLDLGYPRRGARDERKYRKLPDYPKVLENPNIDESTLWRPRADIFDEGADRLRVEFELPGVPKEDISLTVQDDVLTLAALKPQTRKEETGFHYQEERHFGKFYRRLVLPFAVDADNIRAHLEAGVLKVHLTRKEGRGSRVPIKETGETTGSI